MDMRSQMSLAALVRAIHGDGEDKIMKELQFNMDYTSIDLGKRKKAVLVKADAAPVMKDLGRAYASTETVTQDRTLGVLALVTAAGEKVAFIAVVKDSNVKKFQNITVCTLFARNTYS